MQAKLVNCRVSLLGELNNIQSNQVCSTFYTSFKLKLADVCLTESNQHTTGAVI